MKKFGNDEHRYLTKSFFSWKQWGKIPLLIVFFESKSTYCAQQQLKVKNYNYKKKDTKSQAIQMIKTWLASRAKFKCHHVGNTLRVWKIFLIWTKNPNSFQSPTKISNQSYYYLFFPSSVYWVKSPVPLSRTHTHSLSHFLSLSLHFFPEILSFKLL